MGGPSDERGEVLRQFFELPESERLEVFRELRDYLSLELGAESEADRVVKARAEALKDLQRATDHLRSTGTVRSDEAPTVKQFDRAAAELGLDWRGSRVIRTFGTWRNAKRALLGGQAQESPVQRRRRQHLRKATRTHKTPLSALQTWLATDPKQLRLGDYNAWVTSSASGTQTLPSGTTVFTGLGLPWADCIRVAAGELTLSQARAERLARLTEGLKDTSLVGSAVIVALVGVRNQHVQDLVSSERLAEPVARLGPHQAWFYGDVKACRDGRPAPRRQRFEYQTEIYDSAGLSKVVELNQDYARTLIHQQKWHLIPEPEGRVGRSYYWLRRDVSKWVADRRRRESK